MWVGLHLPATFIANQAALDEVEQLKRRLSESVPRQIHDAALDETVRTHGRTRHAQRAPLRVLIVIDCRAVRATRCVRTAIRATQMQGNCEIH